MAQGPSPKDSPSSTLHIPRRNSTHSLPYRNVERRDKGTPEWTGPPPADNPVSAGPVPRGPEKRSLAAQRRQPHRNQLSALILCLWGNGLHHTTPAPFTSESRNPQPEEHRGQRASGPVLPGAPLSAGSERTPPPHPEDPGTCSPSMHPQHSLRRGPTAPGTPRAAEDWVTRAEGFGTQPPPRRAGGGPTGSHPGVSEETHRRWSSSRHSCRNGCLRSR